VVVRSHDVEWLTVNDVGWECLRLVYSSVQSCLQRIFNRKKTIYTIRYDTVYLTCSQNSLVYCMESDRKCKRKNELK